MREVGVNCRLTFIGALANVESVHVERNMASAKQAYYRQRSRKNGYSIAELPVALWVIFIMFLFPLAIMASLGYRAVILYYGVNSATQKAAKSPSFTDAQTNAAAVLTACTKDFPNIKASAPVESIQIKPLSGAAPTFSATKLAAGSVDTSKNIYFVVTQVDADLDPLVQFNGGWMGLNIPGLTGPYHLQYRMEAYCENPNGLTK